MAQHEYRGTPLGAIRIDHVEWTPPAVEHIGTRSKRVRAAEIDIRPEEATEAALDPRRLIRPASGGESLEVLGHSPTLGRVLKVWLYPKKLEEGEWYGASAAVASDRLTRRYTQALGGGQDPGRGEDPAS